MNQTNDKDITECIICLEPIKNAAKKCSKCNSYQSDWRRIINISNTGLALCVSILSLLILFAQNFDKFIPPSSKLAVTLASIESIPLNINEIAIGKDFELLITYGVYNSGSLPTLFESATTASGHYCRPTKHPYLIKMEESKTLECKVTFTRKDPSDLMQAYLDACDTHLSFNDPGGRSYNIQSTNRNGTCVNLHAAD